MLSLSSKLKPKPKRTNRPPTDPEGIPRQPWESALDAQLEAADPALATHSTQNRARPRSRSPGPVEKETREKKERWEREMKKLREGLNESAVQGVRSMEGRGLLERQRGGNREEKDKDGEVEMEMEESGKEVGPPIRERKGKGKEKEVGMDENDDMDSSFEE
ncbi:hypothetical protein BCR34DRAFT_555899 [Clohesyomyces aquaticus]|uniref:Uncharacterized protein n=1 Tax=Clohesyomyces aquaticus TaxID=1231657 RepID=A0A1Y2A4V4_9PLEO|nr:hypothetical protein BCR34DRAFT_555899 [Clohesyomyces aquaticus]